MTVGESRARRRRSRATVALPLALVACGRAPDVTVYTPLEPAVVGWAREAFSTTHPDVALRMEPVAPGALLGRLRAEREDPSARVVWGAPSWVLAAAAAEGLLATEPPSWAASLPQRLRDPGGRWTASLVDPIVLAFDHEQLSRSRAPRDWIDLLHPRFAGEVLVPEPGADPGGTVLLGARAQASMRDHGDILDAIDWLRRLDGQTLRYEADEDAMVRSLGRGSARVALLRLSRAEAARRAGGSLAYMVPESGGPLLVEAVGVTAGGDDARDARAFVAWLGTAEATDGLSEKLHRVPATLVAEPAKLTWLPDAAIALGGEAPDADTLAAHLDAWLERWRRDARGRGPKVPFIGG